MTKTDKPLGIGELLLRMLELRKKDTPFNRIFFRNKISKMTICLLGAAATVTAAQPFFKRVNGWKVIDDCVLNSQTMYRPRYFKNKKLLLLLRLTLAMYCTGVSIVLGYKLGYIPFYTFSILNWNILALYLWCAALGKKYGGKQVERLAWFLKYPALGNAILIFGIFWPLLWFPAFLGGLRGDKFAVTMEKYLRSDFLMLNVHGANVIIAITDYMLDKYIIGNYDLWCNQVVIVAYGLFYHTFLVNHKLDFYFFLSLRSKFAVASHLTVLAAVFGVYKLTKKVKSSTRKPTYKKATG